ncbi:MAG: hypothetical protein RQ757_04715 [Pseudomonadales bacterium]|nr:hypothetical protein [Pseudomonadales bacterium]
MRYIGLITVLVCSIGVASAADNDKFPGVKSLMSAEEIQATGLEKLSVEEIEALNAWLVRYTAHEASTLKGQVAEIREEVNQGMRDRIDGTFTGWDGNTIFNLKSGQVWQQRNGGIWSTRMTDPEVIITRRFMWYYLRVEGTGRSIGVTRLR